MQIMFTEEISKYNVIKSSCHHLKIRSFIKAHEFCYCVHGGAGIEKSSAQVFVS